MPKLRFSSEKRGCGATIELDSGEVVIISVAQTGVLVRKVEVRGLLKIVLSNLFGVKLYSETDVSTNAKVAMHLAAQFEDQPSLKFANAVLRAFANAIWVCPTAASVVLMLDAAKTAAVKATLS